MRTAILVAACVIAGATACSESSSSREVYTPSGPVSLPPGGATTINLSPSRATLAPGAKTRLTAILKDAEGGAVTGVHIVWQSSDTTIASVSDSGDVRGVKLGNALVTASADNLSATSAIVVNPAPVGSVAVTLGSSAISIGSTTQATVVVKDSTGTVVTDRVVTWSSSAPSIATVSSTGMVTGVAAGSATITATSESKSGSASVSVSAPSPAPVASVTVSLGFSSLSVGASGQASVTLKDASGNVLSGRAITWASSNPSIATVSSTGVVQAVGLGTATISATSEGVTGSASVNVVAAPVASVTVTLTSSSLAVGQSTQGTAVTKDANGNVLTGRSITWASSNTAVATVSSTGLVQAVATGSATISASSEGISGATGVVVAPAPVATVTVTLSPTSVVAGQTSQASAVLKDAQGNVLTGRTITWSSSSSVATVSSSGLVQAVTAGTATISATSGGVTGSATLTVTQVPVASVTVTVNSSSLTVGQATQASATLKDASGNVLTGRTISWSSSNTAVATVNSSGLVTAVGAGTSSISATSGGVSGNATITVTLAPVATVTLSPASLSLPVGSTGQLTATLKDASGNTLTGRTITWSSNATAVATVSTTGLVTAVTAGSATITATSEGKNGTSAVTVTTVVSPGAGVPVYDPTNPDHVLHVLEDWSAYTTASDVGVKNRADGGGPWLNGNAAYQTISTNNVDPWYGKKTLDINYQQVPASGQSLENGLTLIQGTPARYLNAASAKEAIVIEWAWRWEGGPYEGKIADFQPYAGTDRFNYQTDPDQLGSQTATSCNSDALCNKYYSNNGGTPRFAGLPPQANYGTGAIARSMYAQNVMFYRQNRNWGAAAGQVDWGGNSWATMGINFVDNRWRRTILRLTMNSGAMGSGRMEEWMEIAGQPAVKVMEFIGDPGGFDAGLVNGRDITQGGSTWITTSATLYLYNLSAVGPIFMGGNTTHLGYVRIWSEPRE